MIEIGNFVTIKSYRLSLMDKFQRERWTGRRCAVMRLHGYFADIRCTTTGAEITLPVEALRIEEQRP